MFQGETFRCHWKTDDVPSPGSTYPSPPQPWCSSDHVGAEDLTFVAEQVKTIEFLTYCPSPIINTMKDDDYLIR